YGHAAPQHHRVVPLPAQVVPDPPRDEHKVPTRAQQTNFLQSHAPPALLVSVIRLIARSLRDATKSGPANGTLGAATVSRRTLQQGSDFVRRDLPRGRSHPIGR